MDVANRPTLHRRAPTTGMIQLNTDNIANMENFRTTGCNKPKMHLDIKNYFQIDKKQFSLSGMNAEFVKQYMLENNAGNSVSESVFSPLEQ